MANAGKWNFSTDGFKTSANRTIVQKTSKWEMIYHNIIRPIRDFFPKIKPAVKTALFPVSDTEEYAKSMRDSELTYLDASLHDLTETLSKIEAQITGKRTIKESIGEISIFVIHNFEKMEKLFSIYYGLMGRDYVSVKYVPLQSDISLEEDYEIPPNEKYGRYIKFIIDLIYSDPDWSVDNWNEQDMILYYEYISGNNINNAITTDRRYISLRDPASAAIRNSRQIIGPQEHQPFQNYKKRKMGGYKKSRKAKSRKAKSRKTKSRKTKSRKTKSRKY